MNKLLWTLPFLLIVGCGGPSQSTDRTPNVASPNPADQLTLRDDAKTEVYKNSSGQIQVAVIPVVNSGANAFLLSISGVDSVIAEHALVHARTADYRWLRYVTTIDGVRRVSFLKEIRSDETSGRLQLPGTKLHYSVYFDATSSSSFDSQRVVERYQKEFAAGTIQTIASFDRAGREKRDNHKMQVHAARMQEDCGSSVSGSIRWEDISDERLLEYGVVALCVTGLRTAAKMCRRFPDAKQQIQKVGRIVCRLENAPGVNPGLTITENGIEYRPFRNNPKHMARMAAQELFDEKEILLRHKDQLILLGPENGDGDRPIFSGRAATGLTRQSSHLLGADEFRLWAADRHALLELDSNTKRWVLHCGDTALPLEWVNTATRKQILKTTAKHKEVWTREPYLLARDDKGVYYYVDKLKDELGGRHFQVFIGRRGQQKLSKLTGVVEDSQGTVFSTPNGDLRLIVDTAGRQRAIWIRGKRPPKQLTMIDPKKDRVLIYDELGAYLDQDYGHICEF